MNNELLEKEEKQNSKQKKRRGTALLLLLIVFLILFLLSTALLGARLYDLTTREKYAVDLWSGAPVGELELFRVEYENTLGEITVRGANADKVVAPGTAVDYDIRLRNNDDVLLEFRGTFVKEAVNVFLIVHWIYVLII